MVRFVTNNPHMGGTTGGMKPGGGSGAMLFLARGNGDLSFMDRAGGGTLTATGPVRYQPAPTARINLVKNPRFATAMTGWSSGNATGTQVSDAAFSQGSACELVSSSAAGAVFAAGTQAGFVTKGQAYTLSFDAYLVSGDGNCRAYFYEADAAGSTFGSFGATSFTATATMQRFSITYTPSQTGVHRLLPAIGKNTSTSTTLRFSNLVLEAGSVGRSYFDGSIGDARWLDPNTGYLGTAHASLSVSLSQFWVWEGTTNGVTDPIFGNATITTAWAVNSTGVTLARDTAFSYYGQASAKLVCDGTTADQGLIQVGSLAPAGVSGQVWTTQAVVRANSATDVGKKVRIQVVERDAAFGFLLSVNSGDFTLTDAWQAISFSYTLVNASTARVSIKVLSSASVAVSFNVDGVQLEQKAYATPLCAGSLGTGHSWAGTANASASTRADCNVTFDETKRIDALKGAVMVLATPDVLSSHDQEVLRVGDGTAGLDQLRLVHKLSTNKLSAVWTSNGGAAVTADVLASWVGGQSAAVYTDWNGTAITTIYPGLAATAATRNAPSGSLASANHVRLGSFGASSNNFDGRLGPVAIFDRPLSAGELARYLSLPVITWGT